MARYVRKTMYYASKSMSKFEKDLAHYHVNMYEGLSQYARWVRDMMHLEPEFAYAMAYTRPNEQSRSHESNNDPFKENISYFWRRSSALVFKHKLKSRFKRMATFRSTIDTRDSIKVEVSNKPYRFIISLAVLVAIGIYLIRSLQNPINMSKDYTIHENVTTSFEEVIGNDEAKEDLSDIIHYLKNPEEMTELGVKIPKGVLLVGPPGTGKTLLARAVAGESRVPFIAASGSEFEEMYVGVGAKRMKKLFTTAKEYAPCIVFIDEIDAIGGKRDDMNNRSYMTLNQLLVEMDGFVASDNVIVIAATNLDESLDPALVRSGRFDRKIYTDLPSSKDRKSMLDFYLKGKEMLNVNTGALSLAIPGFSGSDIQNMVNWAHMQAIKEKTKIKMKHMEDAIMNVAMGREKKSLQLSELTKKICAYHEGGHALVSLHTPGSLVIGRATLIPRGNALGMVNYLEKDDPLKTYQELLASMDTAMGGRVAEEIIFGKESITQGAGSDFQKATQIATSMVTKLGMSSLGPMYIGSRDKSSLSPETQRLVDQEIQTLLRESYERAKKVLKDNEKQLHLLANALIKYEVLTLDEINLVVQGQMLVERDKEIQELVKQRELEKKSVIISENPNGNLNPIPQTTTV